MTVVSFFLNFFNFSKLCVGCCGIPVFRTGVETLFSRRLFWLELWFELLWLLLSGVCSSSSEFMKLSAQLFRGDHVILFSFFSLRRAFANHVDT